MLIVDNGRIVKARSRREVEDLAAKARRDLQLSDDGRVSMLGIIDGALYDTVEGYRFEVREDHEMGLMEGLTDDQKPIIYLKESVNRALERGDGRARMTAAHEFGHLYMHCGAPAFRAFSTRYDPLYDPERQADIFAAAFLMPEKGFRRCKTLIEAMNTFGVSRNAATCRARKLNHRFEDFGSVEAPKKKKGTRKSKSP
jgi:Zn-dependent peptidase ImmA (M78 family)